MYSTIFSDNASHYWSVGLPVIPLLPGQKRPAISGWQQYCVELPSEELQQQWLAAYPNANIGLALGPQSGVVVIDIDSDDPNIMAVIEDVLTRYSSPWHRVGKKGKVLAYRYADQKTFQIKRPGAGVIVELLSTKRQVVLPPSIHPETGQPYTANANLYEVMDDLAPLPADIQRRLRTALRPWIGNAGSSSHGRRRGPAAGAPTLPTDGSLLQDGREQYGTSVRMQTFKDLEDQGQLSSDAFTDESWRRFMAACELGPTTNSPNSYDYESWTRICEGDYRRLQEKFGPSSRLIPGVPPDWSSAIVSLEEGQAQLAHAVSSYFTSLK